MTDLDRTFRSLDLLDPPDVRADIVGRASGPEPARPGPSRGNRVAAVLVAIAVCGAVVALGVRALRSSAVDEPAPSPSPVPVSTVRFPEGFTPLPEPPLQGQGIVMVPGGDQVFLWGGQEGDGKPHRDDGFLLDLETEAWAPVVQGPLSARSDAAAVWTGKEFVVWGGRDGKDWPPQPLADGAAYDPVAETWRNIAPAPIDPLSPPEAVVWTGTEMLVWGDWFGETDALGAAYDPAADTWRVLPTAPVRFNDVSAVWTGTEMVVFGARLGSGNRPQTPATGAAYDPANDTWRPLADTDLSPNSTEIAWDGQRLIAMDYGHEARVLDEATGTWLPLGRLPANQCEGGLSTPATFEGTVVLITCGELIALEPGADRWRVLQSYGEAGPSFAYGPSTAAGGGVLLSGYDGRGSTLWAYRAPATTPDRRAWDVASLYGAIRAGYPYQADQLPNGVEAEVDGLLSVDAKARYDDGSSGLGQLWTYYYGFEVISVDRSADRFDVVLRLEGDPGGRERLTIGPGSSADGIERDLVILDVAPA